MSPAANLGLGAMIRMLDGSNDPGPLVAAVGKEIADVRVDDNKLKFSMADGSVFALADMAQSCCERRHMTCDDDLTSFVGSKLLGARIADGPSTPDEYDNAHDCQFLIVATSTGEFTVANHNEHNGYYGGFSIEVVS